MSRFSLLYFILIASLFAQVPTYTISTVAGVNPSGDNGRARDARLFNPGGIVVDAQGVIYFCDRDNARVRRVGRDGIITTIAGGGDTLRVEDGQPATSALLLGPTGLALNAAANTLYFSDPAVNYVYSIDLTKGTIAIVAGTGTKGASGDGGAAKRANFYYPAALAYDSTLGLLIADPGNNRIRRVDLTTGIVSVFAGSGLAGFAGDGGPATGARLSVPYGVAVGVDHVVYIGDWGNSRIRRVKENGTIDTIAGTGSTRFAGDNGPAISSTVDGYHVTVAADNTLYLSDRGFHRIRRMTVGGSITTVAGTGAYGFGGDGGAATIAQIDTPIATAVDSNGLLYIADTYNHRIRRVTFPSAIIDTIAGRNRFGGDGGPATEGLLSAPADVVYDAAGTLYFADQENHCIRKIGKDGVMTTVAGVGGQSGAGAENVLATTSKLDKPTALAIDTDGTIYIADRGNFRVRRVDSNGFIRTVSGINDFGVLGMALDKQQHKLYFTDDYFQQVMRLDVANPSAIPVPIAGSPNFRAGFSGDGGPALSAFVSGPGGIALAPNGDLYFADTNNGRIRRIDTAGVITTIAGNGEGELLPTDGPLATAIVTLPYRVAVDSQSNIYVSEGYNRIRRISGGRIDTIVGQPAYGFSGDGGPALEARIFGPLGMAIAADGQIVFADAYNHRLRRLTVSTGTPPAMVSRLEARSGNNQSGAVSQLLPQALSVAVVSATGQPVSGAAVTFAVTAGSATLSAVSVNTGTDGLASVTVTLGATAGAVQVTARSGTLTPVVFSLTATSGTPPVTAVKPVISSGGIVGVGLSVPSVTKLTPRGIVTIFGQNFLDAGTPGRRVDFSTEAPGGVLPRQLLGVCVEIGGTRAPMLDVYSTQLNVVVPAVTGTSVSVRVIRRCDLADAAISDPQTVAVEPAAPEFLYSHLNLDGVNPVAAVNAVNGALIGPASLPGFTPAQPGDILTIYANGFGATDPAIVPGGTSAGVASLTAAVRVRIGTVELAPGDILYAGASPASLIYQVNLRVPAAVADGNQPIQIFLNGVPSPPNAYLAVTAPSPATNAPSLEQRLLEGMKALSERTERRRGAK